MKRTDWDRYYQKPHRFHACLRRIVGRRVVAYLNEFVNGDATMTISEFGGGNSCFYEPLTRAFPVREYRVVDNNQAGLEALRRQVGQVQNLTLIQRDILQPGAESASDVVLSVGLIEHFTAGELQQVISTHLRALKKGGVLILGFPTPTLLYRLIRAMAERLGRWRFPDERPLAMGEVIRAIAPYTTLLKSEILWTTMVTQGYIVARKNGE